MSRHSFAHHQVSRGGGLRGWLVGFGVVLAIITGLFTFFIGVLAWFVLGLLRVVTSPFRAKRKKVKSSRPRWTVRVDRQGDPVEVGGRPEQPSPSSTSRPRQLEVLEADDADFEEIR